MNAKLKAFEGAAWSKDKVGLLKKNNCKSDHLAPKALYNLDGGGLYKSIHDCHWPTAAPVAKGNTTKVRFANVNNVDSNDDSSQGSASRSSPASSGLISIVEWLLPKNPSGGNVTSASSDEEMVSLSATSGR